MGVAVQDGRIVEVTAGLTAPAAEHVDAAGQLLSPPFCDAHFHMDTTLTYGQPRVNESGTLLEGIALWGELKPHLTQQAVVDRALAYCDWAVAKGLLAKSYVLYDKVDASSAYKVAYEAEKIALKTSNLALRSQAQAVTRSLRPKSVRK